MAVLIFESNTLRFKRLVTAQYRGGAVWSEAKTVTSRRP